jgi:hypothetical protein
VVREPGVLLRRGFSGGAGLYAVDVLQAVDVGSKLGYGQEWDFILAMAARTMSTGVPRE